MTAQAIPAAPQRRTLRAAWALTGGLLALSAVAWATGLVDSWRIPSPLHIPWPVFAIAFAGADLFELHFEFRRERHAITLSEAPLIPALVFCGPIGVLAARLAGAVAAMALHRTSPVKVLFNLAVDALEVTVVTAIMLPVLHRVPAVAQVAWVAAFGAIVAANGVSYLCVLAVIAVSNGGAPSRRTRDVLVANAIVAVACASLAVITTTVLWTQPGGWWVLALIGLVIGWGFRAYHRLQARHVQLGLLHGFTREIARAQPGAETITEILRRSADAVNCERVELILAAPDRVTRMDLSDDGSLRSAPVSGQLVGISASAVSGRPTLSRPKQHKAPDAMAAPLLGGAKVHGALVAYNRLGSDTGFDKADLHLFESLANHAAVALRNGELIDALRDEAAAKTYQSLHDSLTDLPNRVLFAEQVEALAQGAGASVALMLVDLDAFKELNDTLGHDVGDALLCEIAARLTRVVGATGIVARLGGDEFGIAFGNVSTSYGALATARQVLSAIEQPFQPTTELFLETRASMGVALAPTHTDDPTTLLRFADVAMYWAKHSRSGVELYDSRRDLHTPRRLGLAASLRQALHAGELQVWFQPKARLSDGKVLGVEALLRWPHPTYGMVPPDEFIPIAETSGLIGPLTRLVLGASLSLIRQWQDKGHELGVAINISARSLSDPRLVADIGREIRAAEVNPRALTVEITESSVMADPERSIITLRSFADLGVRLSIDDFGTGHSSLARLRTLPIHEVKVDKSFVQNVASDPRDAALVKSIISLAHNLELTTVAEGVEDATTWARLQELGCDAAQGYHLCRAVPVSKLNTWLTDGRGYVQTPSAPKLFLVNRPDEEGLAADEGHLVTADGRRTTDHSTGQ